MEKDKRIQREWRRDNIIKLEGRGMAQYRKERGGKAENKKESRWNKRNRQE